MSPFRLHRSELAVPGTSERFFEKAARGPADAIFLDLEDAVAPALKDAAREAAIGALNQVDWGRKTMSVRVNGLDTEVCGRTDLDRARNRFERKDITRSPISGRRVDAEAFPLAHGESVHAGVASEHRARLREEERVAAPAREELYLPRGLPEVGLEPERQPAVTFGQVRDLTAASGRRPRFGAARREEDL